MLRLSVLYRLLVKVVRRLFSLFLRIDVISGSERVPKRGPVLILANHVGFLDPFVVSIAAGRPVQFLATPTVFRKPILGLVARFFGVIPKSKFSADIPAIFKLLEWAQLGSAVGIFPEGQRSWDARNLEIVPGIGKLVRMLDAPVVSMRMYNGDRISPRWARKQRKGHVLVEIDEPVRFSRRTDPTLIENAIREKILVDPMRSPKAPAYGSDLALGIGTLLFLCPECYATESLIERGNRVMCTECDAAWEVTSANTLKVIATGRTYPIINALDKIRTFLDRRGWVVNEERFREHGIALESKDMTLLDMNGTRPKKIGTGRLQLTKDGLRLNGTRPWFLSLADILVATVDITTDLQFRSKNGLFGANLRKESVLKWELFVNHWRSRIRGAKGGNPTVGNPQAG